MSQSLKYVENSAITSRVHKHKLSKTKAKTKRHIITHQFPAKKKEITRQEMDKNFVSINGFVAWAYL